MEKLTNRVQTALADAQSLALGSDHTAIEPAHLLHVLLESEDESINQLVQRAGGDTAIVAQSVRAILEGLPTVGTNTGEIRVSPALARVLSRAEIKANRFISSSVS